MRLTDRQENHLATLQAMRPAGNHNLGLAFQHLHQRIKRRGVFAQPFPLVKSEERYIAGGPLKNLPADDGAVLIAYEFRSPGDLFAGQSFRLIWHGHRFKIGRRQTSVTSHGASGKCLARRRGDGFAPLNFCRDLLVQGEELGEQIVFGAEAAGGEGGGVERLSTDSHQAIRRRRASQLGYGFRSLP